MATTYVLKRKSYASVRNPYLEKQTTGTRQSLNQDIAENYDTEESTGEELQHQQESMEVKTSKAAKSQLAKNVRSKTPVYQNLKDNNRLDRVNDVMTNDGRRLRNRNRTVNQNININRNTNINNPAKEKAAELDAQVRMAKMQQQSNQNGGGVNAKLIEIQKTNPLKPLSMS